MARYEHLPIYKKSYDFMVYIENTVRQFGRYNKYAVGAELREYARRIVRTVVKANNLEDKLGKLLELRELLEETKITLQLCKSIRAFHNFNSFQVAINMVIDVSKQNEGWIRSVSGK